MENKLFSTYQAAKILGVHHTTIINWIKENKLNAFITPGGHRRVRKEDIEHFIEEYNIPVLDDFKKKFKRLLIVDDDFEILDEYKEALGNNGFEIDLASDGFEAGKMIYENKPDLILLDFKMPWIDGFKVCEILKREKSTAHIPIFAVTGLSSKENIKKIKECGADEYFSKPVDIKRLLNTIKTTLKINK